MIYGPPDVSSVLRRQKEHRTLFGWRPLNRILTGAHRRLFRKLFPYPLRRTPRIEQLQRLKHDNRPLTVDIINAPEDAGNPGSDTRAQPRLVNIPDGHEIRGFGTRSDTPFWPGGWLGWWVTPVSTSQRFFRFGVRRTVSSQTTSAHGTTKWEVSFLLANDAKAPGFSVWSQSKLVSDGLPKGPFSGT